MPPRVSRTWVAAVLMRLSFRRQETVHFENRIAKCRRVLWTEYAIYARILSEYAPLGQRDTPGRGSPFNHRRLQFRMKAIDKSDTYHAHDYEAMKSEFLSLVDFTNYQLSILAIESIGLTKHSQEFQDWLVSDSVSLPLKIDLLNTIYRDHPQLRAFRQVLSRLQAQSQFVAVLSPPSDGGRRAGRVPAGNSASERVPLDELKSRLAELREVEDVLVYWLACVKRGILPSITADDFVDSVS